MVFNAMTAERFLLCLVLDLLIATNFIKISLETYLQIIIIIIIIIIMMMMMMMITMIGILPM